MKKQLCILSIALFFTIKINAQIGINASNTPPNTSAMLDVSSTTKGILIPRMTTIQKNAIPNKTEGLMVYDTDSKLFSYWIVGTGTFGYWMDFPQTVAPNWYANGSNIYNTNGGNVGIGNYSPTAKLDVAGKIKIGNDSQAGTEGTIRYNSTNKYFEGYDGTNWVAFNANNAPTLPQSAIVLSETKTNTNLTNAGYSLNGITDIRNSQYVSGAFGWYKSLSTVNPVSARNYHTVVWTGTKMIIWGGYDPNSSVGLTDGKTYDPTNDSWSAITTSFLTGRGEHSTIWTGSKMIVWGGESSNGIFLNDGGIYDPTTDSWITINTSNLPSARTAHTAIWTGNKMIIWGGYNGNIRLGDGKIYDLTSNTWASMSMINSPSPRGNHTAIWTGSKMIIWGGYDGGILTNGKIYDPSNNTWTNINSTNAPQSGLQHSAIWTGSKMIIFGGLGFANSCKIYDSQTDTWVTGSSTNAPPLWGHTGIWTGTKMIVFGGNTPYGGIYDPISDSWDINPLFLSDYTSSIGHSAVWTSEDMIIFYANKGNILKKDFKSPASKSMYLFQKN